MARIPSFERVFEPRTIAIIGVSRSEQKQHVGSSGLGMMRALRHAGYQGRIYPINPNASEIDGVRVYSSLISVTEPLDLVIISVPAAAVPQVLEDCIAARAMNVHVCSSGFAETGEEEGIQLLPLSAETRRGLGEFLSTVNQGLTNPLEAASLFDSPSRMNRALKLFDADPGVDMVIVSLMMAYITEKGTDHTSLMLNCLANIVREKGFHKPLAITLSDPATAEAVRYWQLIRQAKILSYPSLRQTCRAMNRYASYYEFLERAGGCSLTGP